MAEGNSDLWHFIFDDEDGSWTWQRISAAGVEVAHSAYSFRSFNVCVVDAELAGFASNTAARRRLRRSELAHDARARGARSAEESRRSFEHRRRARHIA